MEDDVVAPEPGALTETLRRVLLAHVQTVDHAELLHLSKVLEEVGAAMVARSLERATGGRAN